MSFQIFAHKPGFGKTIVACRKVKELLEQDEHKNGYALIVVPKPVVKQWRKEISENDLYLQYELVGRKNERKDFLENGGFLPQCVYLTTPGTLVNDIESELYTKKPSIIVYDEVHLISSYPFSRKNKFECFGTLDENDICRTLAEFNEGINYKIGLTGTPYQNNIADLFSTYAFMEKAEWLANLPPYVKSLWDTDERFKHVKENFADGKTYLFGEAEPKKHFDIKELFVPVKLSDRMSNDVKILQDNHFDLQKISQFLLCPKTFENDSEFNALGVDTKNISSGKILFAEQIIKEIPVDEKIVVFSFYTDVLEQLKYKLVESGYTEDSIVLFRKNDGTKTIERFTAGGAKILLTTLEKAGVGLNLQAANHSIILDFWWNPAVMEQAIHRIIRYDQTRNVHIYFPVYMECKSGRSIKMNDIEEKHIVDAVFRKVNENREFVEQIICERRNKKQEDEYASDLEKYAMQDFSFEAFPKILDMEELMKLHVNDESNWFMKVLNSYKYVPAKNTFPFQNEDSLALSDNGIYGFASCAADEIVYEKEFNTSDSELAENDKMINVDMSLGAQEKMEKGCKQLMYYVIISDGNMNMECKNEMIYTLSISNTYAEWCKNLMEFEKCKFFLDILAPKQE